MAQNLQVMLVALAVTWSCSAGVLLLLPALALLASEPDQVERPFCPLVGHLGVGVRNAKHQTSTTPW